VFWGALSIALFFLFKTQRFGDWIVSALAPINRANVPEIGASFIDWA
jgi:hypothetical protein